MRMFSFALSCACFILLLVSPNASAQGVFGAYEGVVTHSALGRDQLVKLQLIRSRMDVGNLRLRAILTLQFGGFESGEYVSYSYDDVKLNLLSGELTFNQSDQEVHLDSVVIKDGFLRGELRASTGLVGKIVLSNTPGKVSPRNGLIEPLGGEYAGLCSGAPSSIQLFTYRTTEDTTRLGNPFRAYEAKGQVGKYNPSYCSSDRDARCTYSKIKNAFYNFFSGDLVLDGYPYGFNCLVKGAQLNCGECRFERISDEMAAPRLAKPRYEMDPLKEISSALRDNPESSLKGEYFGYVFHENLDVFQKIRIEVSTFRRTETSGSALVLSVVANSYFGDSENEVITYKFDPIDFPNPVLQSEFVLSRPEGDVDVILGVTRIGKGVITGTWNSHIFGRVGSFIATQNGDLPNLPASRMMGPITSGYEEVGGESYIADVIVGKGNAPIGSDNPFDPLKFNGYVWRKRGTVQKEGISGGSFDFYSGKIGILFGEDKALNGRLLPGRAPEFRRLGGGFGTLMQKFNLSKYKKTTLRRGSMREGL